MNNNKRNMKFRIGKPLGFSDLGDREIQEDTMYPSIYDLREDNRFFIVCDGMGGHEKGEVASNTIVKELSKGYNQFVDNGYTVETFEEILESARQSLDQYYNEEYGAHQMGTTLTFLSFTEEGYFAAHIGDSRIYHIRPAKVTEFVFRSKDHTLVSYLLDSGVLTPIKALTFSEKNIINKALLPKTRQEVDIFEGTDVQAGDYFMLCSDGVTEFLTDEMIRFIFAPYRTADEIIELIHTHCKQLSSDNNTCIVIPIHSINEDTLKETTQTSSLIAESLVVDDLLQDSINYFQSNVMTNDER